MIITRRVEFDEDELIRQIAEIEIERYPISPGNLPHAISIDILAQVVKEGLGFIIAALKDDKVVGYSLVGASLTPGELVLLSYVVREEYEGRGIGTKLVKASLEEALKYSPRIIRCTVSPTNSPSVHILMNKFGFEAYMFKRDVYGKGEHRLFLERDMKKPIEIRKAPEKEATSILVSPEDYSQVEYYLNKLEYRGVGMRVKEKKLVLRKVA